MPQVEWKRESMELYTGWQRKDQPHKRRKNNFKKNLNLMKLIQSTVWASYTSRGKNKSFTETQ